jgi:molybdenum cofactor biosynthesis enzyme MoaA
VSPAADTALISTAGHCKIACGFCFRSDRGYGFLDLATYTRALSRLREQGIRGVCLTGGEPTHHPDLRQLVRLGHQFGLSVSMVTSARTSADVAALSSVAHLLDNVTVSADSEGAMRLGRTTRCASSAVATLRAIDTATRVLHLTYWDLTEDECQVVAQLAGAAGVTVQLSPVVLDERTLRHSGLSLPDYQAQQQHDATLLSRHFSLSDRYQTYLDELRDLQAPEEGRKPRACRSTTAYVSADGIIRRCPYGRTSAGVHSPRTAIRQLLTGPAPDTVTPACAAICRKPGDCEELSTTIA